MHKFEIEKGASHFKFDIEMFSMEFGAKPFKTKNSSASTHFLIVLNYQYDQLKRSLTWIDFRHFLCKKILYS